MARRTTGAGARLRRLYAFLATVGFSVSALYGWYATLITLLLLIGSVLALAGQYSGAGLCLVIGGSLGFPLGLFMVGAAHAILLAAEQLRRGLQPH